MCGWTKGAFPDRCRWARAVGWIDAEGRQGRGSPAKSGPILPLSRNGPAKSRPTAGNADRAVLYDFRRFPAVISSSGVPPTRRNTRRGWRGLASPPFEPSAVPSFGLGSRGERHPPMPCTETGVAHRFGPPTAPHSLFAGSAPVRVKQFPPRRAVLDFGGPAVGGRTTAASSWA